MLTSVDTNLLVYFADLTAGERHDRARLLMPRFSERGGVLSQQVLGDFLNVCRRTRYFDQSRARRIAADLAATYPILPTTPNLLLDAFDLAARHKLQFWDAVILTVCRANGVTTLLTEDMQDGAVINDASILDPFDPANRARLDRVLA